MSAVAFFPHHGLGYRCSDNNIDSDRNVLSSLSRGKNVLVVMVNLVTRIPSPASLTQLTDMIVLLTVVIFMTDKKAFY